MLAYISKILSETLRMWFLVDKPLDEEIQLEHQYGGDEFSSVSINSLNAHFVDKRLGWPKWTEIFL